MSTSDDGESNVEDFEIPSAIQRASGAAKFNTHAEATHRAEIEPWHYRERRVSGWGVALLFLAVLGFVLGMAAVVVLNWPEGQY